MMRPSRRALVWWVAAAFGAVAAAFGAVNLMLVLSLKPEADDAGQIAASHLQAVTIVSSMRGFVAEMRDAVVLAQGLGMDAPARLAAPQEQVARAQAALGEASRRLGPLLRDLPWAEQWGPLRADILPALGPLANEALQALAARRGDWGPMADFLSRASEADAGLQEIAFRITGHAREDAEGIRRSLARFSLGSLALGAAGALSALALLLLALKAIGQYARAAESRLADLEAFASRVAHDLRNPLQTIQLGVSSVARIIEEPRLRAFCARAERSARRLDRMIEDLLLFSRGADSPAAERRAALAEVLEELGEDMAARAAEAGVTFSARAPAGLVAAMTPGALRSVAANLLENAFKFLQAEGERRVEATGERAADGSVVFTVRDTGRGIAPEALPHVFEVGYREQGGSGFGIGLATVKRLVDAYGGSTTIESQAGRGTTVTVRLPAAEPPSRSRTAA